MVKNPMNHQKAYAGLPSHIVLDLVGPTTPRLRSLPWTRLDRPTWPVDDIESPWFQSIDPHDHSA